MSVNLQSGKIKEETKCLNKLEFNKFGKLKKGEGFCKKQNLTIVFIEKHNKVFKKSLCLKVYLNNTAQFVLMCFKYK